MLIIIYQQPTLANIRTQVTDLSRGLGTAGKRACWRRSRAWCPQTRSWARPGGTQVAPGTRALPEGPQDTGAKTRARMLYRVHFLLLHLGYITTLQT